MHIRVFEIKTYGFLNLLLGKKFEGQDV
jgi:hypothetical protein